MNGSDASDSVPESLYCFTVTTSLWEKKGKTRHDRRDFVFACQKEEDRIHWVYRIQYQIDLIALRGEERGSLASTKTGNTDRDRIANGYSTRGSDASQDEHRPSISTIASDKTKNKGGLLSKFAKRRRSLLAPDVTIVKPGVEILTMSPEDFAAISKTENLDKFWQGAPSSAHVKHNYVACSDLSLVSRNSNA